MAVLDRRTALCQQKRVTGIDFIQVVDPAKQTLLRVYFIVDPDGLDDPIVVFNDTEDPVDAPANTAMIVSISGGENLAEVAVRGARYKKVEPSVEDSRTVLEIRTAVPGDFSIYRLTLTDRDKERFDPFFNGVEFSFKQGCPSDLDCQRQAIECPPESMVDFPIDYLARDFVSLRNALLDFAAQRYPQWSERIEADVGVMLLEIMAALGDELSYVQDRYAREAFLETASQRRSLRRHAQLVDYQINNGLNAQTYLDLRVSESEGGYVNAGTRFWALIEGEPPIVFEVGDGFADTRPVDDEGNPRRFWVHQQWQDMPVHQPDLRHPCLPIGTTELYLKGKFPTEDQPPAGEDLQGFWIGRRLLLRAEPNEPSLPHRRHLIKIAEVMHTQDPLCPVANTDPENPTFQPTTRIRWEQEQALPFELCITETTVSANIVPATAGETIEEFFMIGDDQESNNIDLHPLSTAVERQGSLTGHDASRSVTHLYSLQETENRGLGWLGKLQSNKPEIEVAEIEVAGPDSPNPDEHIKVVEEWRFRDSLLDSESADPHFTLDDGIWRRIIGFQRIGEEIEHQDYANGNGFTLRFGNGKFGRVPERGALFRVRYRTGPGARANLPRDSVMLLNNPLNESDDNSGFLAAATNPLEITSGEDPESAEIIKQIAPEEFRALLFRAVRTEDFEQQVERLPGVQRGGARFRWTGSWSSAFVTADPLGSFQLSSELREQLKNLTDCVRQVGREVFVRDPEFANIDLDIAICVEPFAYPGQVKARVVEALIGKGGPRPQPGFFDPDNFTFGTPLSRPALEAAIQSVRGVRAVEEIKIRARGITPMRLFTESCFEVADHSIIRLQNNPRFPERGSLHIRTMVEEQA